MEHGEDAIDRNLVLSRRLRRFLVNLGLVLSSLLVAMLVAEGGLRLLAGSDPSLLLPADDGARSTVVGDDAGFPVVESIEGGVYWAPRPADDGADLRDFARRSFSWDDIDDDLRIVLLGDSIAAGFSEPEKRRQNFSFLLETRLRQRQGQVTVANLAFGGYSTPQERETLERFGLRFKPHLVLLEFAPNDFTSYRYSVQHPGHATRKGAYVVNVGPYRVPLSLPLPDGLNRALCEPSFLVRFLNVRIDGLRQLWDMRPGKEVYDATRKEVFEALSDIHRMTEEAGALLVVALFPRTDVPFSEQSRNDEGYGGVEDFARERGIPVFDLVGAMGDEDVVSLRLDERGHYNEIGHRVVANKLFSFFEANAELLNKQF